MAIDDQTQVDLDDDKGDKGDKGDDDTKTDDDLDTGDDDAGSSGKEYVKEILDEFDLDSPEELKDFVKDLASLKGKIGENDLDKLIENSETLEKFQAHWAKEEQTKLKDSETPEQTIERLEKERDEIQGKRKTDSDNRKAKVAAERALDDFNDTVTGVIKSDKTVPDEYRKFFGKFMGVDNPVNDVNIDDKAAVRRLTKASVKDLMDFEQAVIKRYKSGKAKIPVVTKTETDAGSDTDGKKIKSLADARRVFRERILGTRK
jgi:hypothetical protein